MNWTIKTFDQLTSKEIYEILRSRAEVFVKEQRISYVDPDGVDYKSWHVFATENDKVCAYLRAFKDGEDTIKIGRVLTLMHGKGTGTQLMKYAISELKAKTLAKKSSWTHKATQYLSISGWALQSHQKNILKKAFHTLIWN